jgi:SAM-dependent methyltransferase
MQNLESRSGNIDFKTFSRTGKVLTPVERRKRPMERYKVYDLDSLCVLSKSGDALSKVEDEFERNSSQGMDFIAETDTIILQSWLGNITGKRILDIGTGTGRITLPIAEAVGNRGYVYGIDTSRFSLEALTEKAEVSGIPPNRMRLVLGDFQLDYGLNLVRFVEFGRLDSIIIWSDTFASMTENPQQVLDCAFTLLKSKGSLLLETNSLNGISYTTAERAIKEGASQELPLGYTPSFYIQREYPKYVPSDAPLGIIRNGQSLPFKFYDLASLREMVEKAGFNITDLRGISRLTGIYPADPAEKEALQKYVEIVASVEPTAAEQMMENLTDPGTVWEIAKEYDLYYSDDEERLPQYNFLALKGVKP